jgi:hypothetical protein
MSTPAAPITTQPDANGLTATLVVFDALAVAGADLRAARWSERRARLEELLGGADGAVRLTPVLKLNSSLHAALVADGWEGIGVGPVGQHRDSGALDRSNFDVIHTDLRNRFADDVQVERFGHWGMGWVEELSWNAGNPDLAAHVESWSLALSDYPVADESASAALEHEELVSYCRTLPAFVERDGIDYESPRYMDAAQWSAELAGLAFERFSWSSDEDVREDLLIDAAIEVGLYVPEPESVRTGLAELQGELDHVRELVADVERGVRDFGELCGAAITNGEAGLR